MEGLCESALLRRVSKAFLLSPTKPSHSISIGQSLTWPFRETFFPYLHSASSSSRRDFAPSAAEESSQWRRAGPLPARETAPTPRRGPSFASPSGMGGAPSEDRDRDWGAARGAKFVPAPPVSTGFGGVAGMGGGGLRRDSSGPGIAREYGQNHSSPSVADDAGQWRSARPAAADLRGQSGPAAGGVGRAGSGQSSPSLADAEPTVSAVPRDDPVYHHHNKDFRNSAMFHAQLILDNR